MKNRNMLQKWLIILFLGLIIQAVSAQNINVHGIITDETGETMIGVSVLVKGTSTGVVTDVNGNFSLSVPKNSVLSISYIEMCIRDSFGFHASYPSMHAQCL